MKHGNLADKLLKTLGCEELLITNFHLLIIENNRHKIDIYSIIKKTYLCV